MFQSIFANVRARSPLVHNITNYVTVNDCANMVLACGASPIMADDAAEVEDITSLCAGLNLNIGTLNSRTLNADVQNKTIQKICDSYRVSKETKSKIKEYKIR